MGTVARDAHRDLPFEIAEAEQRADDEQLAALDHWIALREAARIIANDDGGSDGAA
jgi:hypothetical protein